MPYPLFLPISLATLGAIAYFLCLFSPFFLWIAPLPLLFLTASNFRLIHLPLIFLGYLLGNFLQGIYVYHHTLFPVLETLLPVAFESFFFTAVLWFTGYCFQRFQSWIAVFVFPTFWVSYLYLSIQFLFHGNVSNLPIYSQHLFLSIAQIVSVTGLFGLSFVTTLFPSGLMLAWIYRNSQPKEALMALLCPFITLAACLIFGTTRLQNEDNHAKVKVGLAAKNPARLLQIEQNSLQRTQEFVETVRRLAERGAEYILQPEESLYVMPEDQTEIFGMLSQAAQQNKATVFAPIRFPDQNTLYVFGPEGTILMRYTKMHLVPRLEKDFKPGTTLSTLRYREGMIGLAICHDMDFFQPTRNYSKEGVGLMFVPAADFGVKADGKWHTKVAILQSMTGGFSLARAAFFGYLSVSDRKGRILDLEATRNDQEVYVVAEVPVASGRTLYAIAGDWFSWLNCLAALFFLVWVCKPSHKPKY